MLLDAGTLAVEFVVLGSDELLGGLAAVHAAAQRRTDGGHTLAGAEEGALGKHGGVWARADRAWVQRNCRRGGGLTESEVAAAA